MSSRAWRSLLILLSTVPVVVLLAVLSQRLPAGGRSLETVSLFALFVASCLLWDRWMGRRLVLQGSGVESVGDRRRLVQLRIGVPEGLVHLEALRRQQRLEQLLAPMGVAVSWHDYPSASTLLVALHRGEIDFCGGGGTPSVFAQASELLFIRVARDKYTSPGGEAILVPDPSPIRTIRDLVHRRVAVEEGSTAHYILVRALIQAGLDPADVSIVFLPRQDALPRFTSGDVDAWSVWVPYADSPRRHTYPGRSIASLQSLFGDEPSLQLPTLYYATPELVRDHPATMKLLLEQINEAGAQVNHEHLADVERLRRELKVSDEWLERLRAMASERTVVPLDGRAISGLQQQAEVLRDLRLIPKRPRISDGTYTLLLHQNWTM